ncbi:ParB-like partition protein [Variovorax sp. CF313]|uniref:ParB/RepB/Spo0J family partition protein n=1 Tax=Variovorax sp. CF313 TaxID=1144315 RepID=UPI000271025B|nr:ParB/RepB/Spo0J family partition protein [Variovorax sp. CF313]EJL76622.1 ParB-like partition protein [Variovorax sp. CF313]
MTSTFTAQRLDPADVTASRFATRHPRAYETAGFQSLKADIAHAGGNDQAIKVRALLNLEKEGVRYEIVFGHRRHRACLELGLPVNAVVEPFMTDAQLHAEMERENRYREDLSPWELGRRYLTALDAGLYPSMRQMAAQLGIDCSAVSKAMGLAKLPLEVVDAFSSPVDLQLRWSTALADAMALDPAGVIERARTIRAMHKRPAASAVFSMLVSKRKMP